jgi:hypothetical protein
MKFILASLSINAMCLIGAMCFGAMCLSANAQQAAPVLGYGGTTCGTWIVERRAGSYSPVTLHAWITGYLSGVALTDSATLLNGIDDAFVDGWIDNYCNGHQPASLSEATGAFVKELLRYRPKNSN